MIGLTTKIKDREYKIPDYIVLSLIVGRQEFIMEGNGYITSFQKIREGIEYEFTVQEFDEPTERIPQDDNYADIDQEYTKMIEDEELQWQFKLQQYRSLEAVLKEGGLISCTQPNNEDT